MTPLEFLVILALVAVLAVLLYSYLQNNRELNLGRVRSDATGLGQRVYGEASDFGEKVSGEGTMSGMSEKLNVSGVSEKVSGVGEKVSDMGGKIKDKVSTSSSTDDLSERIDLFMSEKSDQMIEGWELATKNDITGLEKRFETATRNIGDLEKRFDEYRGSTNKKLEKIEERLEKLETPEE